MLAGSFRLVTARLSPRPCRCKLALLSGALILAGCGGSGEPKAQWQAVSGRSFRFNAPSGWGGTTTRRPGGAKDGGAHGVVTSHNVVDVDGNRSHSYVVTIGKRADRYTFVLRGKREFLLVCSAD